MEHLEKELCLLLTEIRLFFEEELYILRLEIRLCYLHLLRCYCLVMLGYYDVKYKVIRAIPACFFARPRWRNIKRRCLLSSLKFIVRQLEQDGLHN
jgi:hypothetical protein